MVVLLVTGQAGEAGCSEPFEVVGEPSLDGGEFGGGYGFGVSQEGDGLGNFGQVDCFDETFGPARLCRKNDLGVEEARGHARCGIDEPCSKMNGCLLGVAFFVGKDEGGGEGRNVQAQVEESISVSGKSGGIGRT